MKNPSEYINEDTVDTLSKEGLHIIQEAIKKAQVEAYNDGIEDSAWKFPTNIFTRKIILSLIKK